MFTFITHFEENKLLQRQNCFVINSHRVSSRAVCISSRAVQVFPALSLRRVRPSYGTFFLMVFQGNCARGRTGHMTKHLIQFSLYYLSSGRLREVNNKRKCQTFRSFTRGGRLQRGSKWVIWFGNFWYFGKLVAEKRWSQPEVRL